MQAGPRRCEVRAQRRQRGAVRAEPDRRRRVVGREQDPARHLVHARRAPTPAGRRGPGTPPPRTGRASTTSSGAIRCSLRSSQPRQRVASVAVGVRLPGGRHCSTLTTATSDRSSPASASSRSSSTPALPTNGRPVRSSSAPGASPTSASRAPAGASPTTTVVRLAASSGQAAQACAAAASSAQVAHSAARLEHLQRDRVDPGRPHRTPRCEPVAAARYARCRNARSRRLTSAGRSIIARCPAPSSTSSSACGSSCGHPAAVLHRA